MPRPYGLALERDVLGNVFRALIVGRLKLPAGGRGTDRDIGEFAPPGLALEEGPGLVLEEGPANGFTPPCGGRGTLRFMAICGALRFAIAGVLAPRFGVAAAERLPKLCAGRDRFAPPRADVDTPLCEAAMAGDGFAKLLGGVMRLTVGREKVAADGCAAGKPAFGPSMLARVGDTFGLPMLALERFRNALGEMFARFLATGNPRSRVFRETAVRAPGLLA